MEFQITSQDSENYKEVTPEVYTQYELEDTIMIRAGAYLPRYYLKNDAVTTKEKVRRICESIYDLAVNRLKRGVREVNQDLIVTSLRDLIKVQVEYPKIVLPQLQLTAEEKECIRKLC